MQETKYRAYICCGRECGPKGSGLLLKALEREVESQHIEEKVAVLPTGCQSHCESGPTMVVYPGPVYYERIDVDKLRRIVREHFLGGRPVAELFWRPPSTSARSNGSGKVTASGSTEFNWTPPREQQRAPQRPVRRIEDADDFKW